MRQLSIILMLLFSLNLTAYTQPDSRCGALMTEEDREIQTQRLFENIRAVSTGNVSQSREVVYIPVKFHLAARADGSGRINEGEVFNQLCELNEDFAPYEMQFFLADGTFNYINNTTLYENHSAVQNSVMQPQRDSRAVNIFIVESVDDPDEPGTTLAYYHTIRDWIVSRKQSVTANKIDVTHEVGHFFSLLHTFNGWECESYDTVNEPAPTVASCGSPATERQNGTNCTNSGDYICDTPADYGFSNPCNFTANVLDPLGEQVHPDETNFMSYFLNCNDDDYHYSNIQENLMRADYNSNGRNYLRADPVPALVEINDVPTHSYPTPGSIVTVEYYDYINFQWDPVAGASHYFVEISRTQGLTVNPIRVIVEGTSLLVEDLEIDTKYYWRVKPFNAHVTCAAPSTTESFRTGIVSGTNSIPDFLNSITVFPNPVYSNQSLNIALELDERAEGSVKLIDAAGRIIQSTKTRTLSIGENNFQMDTKSLSSGLYFVQLQTDKGQISRKVVVLN